MRIHLTFLTVCLAATALFAAGCGGEEIDVNDKPFGSDAPAASSKQNSAPSTSASDIAKQAYKSCMRAADGVGSKEAVDQIRSQCKDATKTAEGMIKKADKAMAGAYKNCVKQARQLDGDARKQVLEACKQLR